jgi:hypothetical protein
MAVAVQTPSKLLECRLPVPSPPPPHLKISNVEIHKDGAAKTYLVKEESLMIFPRPTPESANVYTVELEGFTDFGAQVILKENSEHIYSEKYSEYDFYHMVKHMQPEYIPYAFKATWLYANGARAEGLALQPVGYPIDFSSLSEEEKGDIVNRLRKIYGEFSKEGVVHGDDMNVGGNWMIKEGKVRVIDFDRAFTSAEMDDIPAVRINAHALEAMIIRLGLVQKIDLDLTETASCEKWLWEAELENT